MRRLIALTSLVLMLAGCSSQAPSRGPADDITIPVPIGTECMLLIAGEPAAPVPFTRDDGEFYALNAGVKCRVLDGARDAEGQVIVKLLEGPNRGDSGKVARSHLAPIR